MSLVVINDVGLAIKGEGQVISYFYSFITSSSSC